jgi:hypothetical protein
MAHETDALRRMPADIDPKASRVTRQRTHPWTWLPDEEVAGSNPVTPSR